MNKKNVYQEYDYIDEWFQEKRNKSLMEKNHLDFILHSVKEKQQLLDLGCGFGEPIAAYMIDQGFCVTGVDGSYKMIARAKELFPEHQWIKEDMRSFDSDIKFDVILAWHSFFHLPKEDQIKMFPRFQKLTKNGGILAFTAGPHESEVWSENGGRNLFHASLSFDQYQKLLNENGFTILKYIAEDPECGEATIYIAKKEEES